MGERLNIVITATDKTKGAFGGLRKGLAGLQTLAVAGAGAMTAYGAAVFASAKHTAKAYDAVQKFSDRIGISTEALSQYQYVAELSGVSNEALRMGFQRMTRRISEATQGLGVAGKALEELEIPIKDIASLTPDKQFEKIAESLMGLESQTTKVRLAMQFFDSEGVALLQTMTSGKEGIEAMKEEAEKFGLVVSSEAGQAAAGFNDSLTRLMGSVTGLKNKFSEELFPTFTGVFNRLANVIADNRSKIISFVQEVGSKLQTFGVVGAYVVAGLVDSWRGLQMIFQTLKIGFNNWVGIYLKGVDMIMEGYVQLMSVANFNGMFDGAIEKLGTFQTVVQDAMWTTENGAKEAKKELDDLVNTDSAVSKVGALKTAFEQMMAEIKEEGKVKNAVGGGFGDLTLKNVEVATQSASAIRDLYNQMFLSREEQLDLWYQKELDKKELSLEDKFLLDEIYAEKQSQLEDTRNKDAAAKQKSFFNTSLNTIKSFGKKGFKIYQGLAIGEAIMSAYGGAARAFKDYMYPWSVGVAALALAGGLAQVKSIRAQKPAAHGGLDYVPKEQTYLLDKGERVLSPNQNKDLTDFVNNGSSGQSVVVENINILPNATRAQALLELSNEEWMDIVEQKINPAAAKLTSLGAI